ncbi:MAG: MarR family transcriptional regulator [Dehalococcoidia bacterium]
MDTSLIDAVLDTLSQMPKIHRALQRDVFRKALEQTEPDLSRLHLEIMNVLQTEGTLHMVEIADLLMISKPQMSRLIDELIELGIVKREPELSDRRKSNITLTPTGDEVQRRFRSNIEHNIKTWLSRLTEDELKELEASFRKVGDIVSRLRDQ